MKDRNYRAFYALLGRMNSVPDKEEFKREMASQYSGGKAHRLHELTDDEYQRLLADMERVAGVDKMRERYVERRRMLRSQVLHQMQVLGIDTSDWKHVDDFCLNPRIAGKRFCLLSPGELEDVGVKLRIIQRKRNERRFN